MEEQENIKPLVSPWEPTTDRTDLKVFGKALEELGELVSALARCVIQGIGESEPVTKKPNLQWVTEEIADACATLRHVMYRFNIEEAAVVDRSDLKFNQLAKWHSM